MISETQIAYGSSVRRHGRSRAARTNHASNIGTKAVGSRRRAAGRPRGAIRFVYDDGMAVELTRSGVRREITKCGAADIWQGCDGRSGLKGREISAMG